MCVTITADGVPCKILCHNICVLIQPMYELDVTPLLELEEKQKVA